MEAEIIESQLEKALEADLQIGGVQVVGCKRTRPEFLEWILRLSGQGDTFGSILENLTEVIDAVKQTDTFESVEAYLEESKDKGKTDVIFTLEEKQRTSITLGTESGGTFGDTTVGGSFHVRNVFGRLETLRANAGSSPTSVTSSASSSMGSKNYFSLEFTKPFLFDLASSLGFRLYSSEEKISYSVDKYGADVILSLPLLTLSYEASWRKVSILRA
uniref:Bacterial surface antigen (D15) domain-containing protein n=1 Tax=Rhodosorus marinus TaxID=101924 RepID=A0A7S2ZFM5_9RHOD|mmetsp:Transcript_17953/g.71859  ORF Transcript_17953/g.71859 Transcript_17953/m.71859 type:complete len:217 (+) Transcript_17953:256-906(+)